MDYFILRLNTSRCRSARLGYQETSGRNEKIKQIYRFYNRDNNNNNNTSCSFIIHTGGETRKIKEDRRNSEKLFRLSLVVRARIPDSTGFARQRRSPGIDTGGPEIRIDPGEKGRPRVRVPAFPKESTVHKGTYTIYDKSVAVNGGNRTFRFRWCDRNYIIYRIEDAKVKKKKVYTYTSTIL